MDRPTVKISKTPFAVRAQNDMASDAKTRFAIETVRLIEAKSVFVVAWAQDPSFPPSFGGTTT
jgi:hypothetical protein